MSESKVISNMTEGWWFLVGFGIYAISGAIACGLVDGLDASDSDGELFAIAAVFGPVVIAVFGLWGIGHLTAKIARTVRRDV